MAIRVLIVDDSATAREVLKNVLSKDAEIDVVGVAPDAFIARDKIVKLRPDVICLDVEMPRMDGVTFLRKIMAHLPTPVIMVSSLTQKGAQTTLDALDAGAFDFVPKPHSHIYDGIDQMEAELISKIKIAAKSQVSKQPLIKKEIEKPLQYSLSETTNKIIAIGASTGGTVALKELLVKLPKNFPGIVIVQHMPGSFTKQFAQRLDEDCQIDVKEAENGDTISMGQALIAPGDFHMIVKRNGARYFVEIGEGRKISGHKPSVDVLFNSCSKYAGANVLGVILTGMGSDGAKGMLNMHNAGAKTIAQDEKSCVVYGMPCVAVDLGGVDFVESLDNIPKKLIEILDKL